MTNFDSVSNISIYLALFEKEIARTNIVNEDLETYVLSLLPLEIVSIIAREQTPDLHDYD